MGDDKEGKRTELCLLSAKSRAAWDGEAGEGKVSLSQKPGRRAHHTGTARQTLPGADSGVG